MRQAFTALAFSTLFLTTGCATLANGVRQEAIITSEPLGAAAFVNDVPVGITPVRVSLKRSERNVVVRFEKNGFATQRIALKRTVSGWVALNGIVLNPYAGQGMTKEQADAWTIQAPLVLGVLLGADFATGGAYKFPKVVRAVLEGLPRRN
jgi:hypothetical protein